MIAIPLTPPAATANQNDAMQATEKLLGETRLLLNLALQPLQGPPVVADLLLLPSAGAVSEGYSPPDLLQVKRVALNRRGVARGATLGVVLKQKGGVRRQEKNIHQPAGSLDLHEVTDHRVGVGEARAVSSAGGHRRLSISSRISNERSNVLTLHSYKELTLQRTSQEIP